MTKWIAFYTFQRNHNLLGSETCLVYYMVITFTVNNYKATWCIVYMGNIIHGVLPKYKENIFDTFNEMEFEYNTIKYVRGQTHVKSSYLFRILLYFSGNLESGHKKH